FTQQHIPAAAISFHVLRAMHPVGCLLQRTHSNRLVNVVREVCTTGAPVGKPRVQPILPERHSLAHLHDIDDVTWSPATEANDPVAYLRGCPDSRLAEGQRANAIVRARCGTAIISNDVPIDSL